MRQIVERLRTQFARSARDKGLELRLIVEPSVPKLLMGDSLRVSQVLMNLISNAVKFTSSGFVELHVSAALMDDANSAAASHELVLQVSDTGSGMSTEQLGRLFVPFQQADASIARTHGGTGLGLVIARRLLEIMGGTLTVESEPQKGTRMCCRLPMNALPDEAPGAALAGGPGPLDQITLLQLAQTPQGLRVLVVDDNRLNATMLSRMLAKAGLQVELAASGEQALALVQSESFDAVLMDLYMPGMNGIETTHCIHARSGLEGLPIVACSATVTQAEKDECLAAGMVGFVAKPVAITHLLRELTRVIPAAIQG